MTSLPAHLAAEIDGLRESGYTVDLIEAEGWFNTVFHNYPVPPVLSKAVTELLVKLPLSYRDGRPDMFWTDVDLVLKDGRIPRSADQIETALGRQWRRFSWHPQSWNPATDNLLTYLEFINLRLAKAE